MSVFGTPVTVKTAVSSSSGAVTVTSNTAANDLIVVFVVTSGNSPTSPNVTDTIGNTYTLVPNSFTSDANGTRQRTYYCLNSSSGNASNVVSYNIAIGGTPVALFVTNVPVSSGSVTIDNFTNAAQNSNVFSSGSTTTASFTTTGTDEIVFIALEMSNHATDTVVASGGNTVTGTTPPNAGSSYNGGIAYQVYSSTQTSITQTLTTSTPGTNMVSTIIAVGFKGAAVVTYSISGNAGVAGATVSWTGTASGSTTADGAGNYTIPSLAPGTYLVTPTKGGYTFTPTNSSQTITSSNITGVNFTATPVASNSSAVIIIMT